MGIRVEKVVAQNDVVSVFAKWRSLRSYVELIEGIERFTYSRLLSGGYRLARLIWLSSCAAYLAVALRGFSGCRLARLIWLSPCAAYLAVALRGLSGCRLAYLALVVAWWGLPSSRCTLRSLLVNAKSAFCNNT